MRNISKLLLLGSCGLSTACASTPDMQVSYFHPKGMTQFKAVETLGCDKDFNLIGTVNGEITTKYSADRSKDPFPVQIKKMDGQLSDADLSFEFFDDGRLKGLNAESTGQGEAIVKAAAAIFKVAIAAFTEDGSPAIDTKPDCDNIAKWSGDKKVVTLTYVGETDFPQLPADKTEIVKLLQPDTNSIHYAANLANVGSVCAAIGKAESGKLAAEPLTVKRSDFKLKLLQPATSIVEIRKYSMSNCQGDIMRRVATTEVAVPQRGSDQYIILPKAAAFGKQSVALTLSEAGTITKLKYGKTSGVASALNAGGAAFEAVSESRAERIARLKEEADLIVAQERLVRCLASKEDCK